MNFDSFESLCFVFRWCKLVTRFLELQFRVSKRAIEKCFNNFFFWSIKRVITSHEWASKEFGKVKFWFYNWATECYSDLSILQLIHVILFSVTGFRSQCWHRKRAREYDNQIEIITCSLRQVTDYKEEKLTELKKYVIECSVSEHADNRVNLDAHLRYTMKRDFSISANFTIRNP